MPPPAPPACRGRSPPVIAIAPADPTRERTTGETRVNGEHELARPRVVPRGLEPARTRAGAYSSRRVLEPARTRAVRSDAVPASLKLVSKMLPALAAANFEIEGRLRSTRQVARKMKAPHALLAAAMCAALLLIAQHTQGATTVSVVRDSLSPDRNSPPAHRARRGPAGGRPPTPHPPTPS